MNPYARPFACSPCSDTRRLTKSVRCHEGDIVPCGACGNLNDEEYERFRRDAWIKAQTPPAICELDLTPAEFETFKALKVQHPNASKTTVLSWIEGQRYRPEKDEEFLNQARDEFRKWRAR